MKKRLFFCCVFVLTILPTVLYGQPGLPDTPDQTPLGGIELLAAAGGAYALKKLRDKKKEE